MSMCLPPHGKSGNCYGCGKPVCDGGIDPEWYKKGHITVNITLGARKMDGSNETINPNYNFTVHSIECMKKVDWEQVKADLLECERRLMHSKRENDDIGV